MCLVLKIDNVKYNVKYIVDSNDIVWHGEIEHDPYTLYYTYLHLH